MSALSLTVLLVENEPALASAIRRALERRGHRVTLATCAEEALAPGVHEVLVCDVGLPGMDGLQLSERLLARPEPPRLVLVSSERDFEACREALRLGAADFLSKPFRLDELVTSVERAAGPSARRLPGFDGGLARTYRAGPRANSTAVRDLLGYCLRSGIGPSTRSRIGTAVAGIVANAFEHGYCGADGEIELFARADERTLRVSVRDHGVGFETLPILLERMRSSADGGLARASALCEELSIDSRPGHGAEVRLSFGCSRLDFDEGRKIDLSDVDYLTPTAVRSVVERLRSKEGDQVFHLSPASAVTIGRLLSGPHPRQPVQGALWS